MADQALHTSAEAQKYLDALNQAILNDIQAAYPIHRELKLTKAYLAWMNSGQPKGDPRASAYVEMEAVVTAIKAKYQVMKAYAKQRLAELESIC